MTRVGVIGAGPVGMALVTALKLAGNAEVIWYVRNDELQRNIQQNGLEVVIQKNSDALELGQYAPEDPERIPEFGLSWAETAYEAVQRLLDLEPSSVLHFREGEVLGGEEAFIVARPEIVFSCTKASSVLQLRSAIGRRLSCLMFFITNGFWLHPGMDLGVMFGGGYANGNRVSLIPEGRLALGRIKSPYSKFLATKPDEDNAGTLIYRHEELEMMETLSTCLDRRFILPEVVPDIYPVMARKAALNCLMNPLAALAEQPNAVLLLPEVRPIVLKLCEEIVGIMQTAKIMPPAPGGFASSELLDDFVRLCSSAGANRGSLQLDRMLNRRGEVQYLNGMLLGIAQRFGLEMPMNATILSLLQFSPL
jgi:ketopantoate reductase